MFAIRRNLAAEHLEVVDRDLGSLAVAQLVGRLFQRVHDAEGGIADQVAFAVQQFLAASDQVAAVRQTNNPRIGPVHLFGTDHSSRKSGYLSHQPAVFRIERVIGKDRGIFGQRIQFGQIYRSYVECNYSLHAMLIKSYADWPKKGWGEGDGLPLGFRRPPLRPLR